MLRRGCVSLLFIGTLVEATGPAAAVGGGANPVQQGSPDRLEQREKHPAGEAPRSGQESPKTATNQGEPERLLDRDLDRLRELEQELSKEQSEDRNGRDGLPEN